MARIGNAAGRARRGSACRGFVVAADCALQPRRYGLPARVRRCSASAWAALAKQRRGARAGQDADRQDAGAPRSRQLRAHPVHARSGARRPDGHAHLQPEERAHNCFGTWVPALPQGSDQGVLDDAEHSCRVQADTPLQRSTPRGSRRSALRSFGFALLASPFWLRSSARKACGRVGRACNCATSTAARAPEQLLRSRHCCAVGYSATALMAGPSTSAHRRSTRPASGHGSADRRPAWCYPSCPPRSLQCGGPGHQVGTASAGSASSRR